MRVTIRPFHRIPAPLDSAAHHAQYGFTTFQPRWLFHPSRFPVLPSATDSPVSTAPTPDVLVSTHCIALTQQKGAVRVSEDGGGVPKPLELC